MDPRIYVDTQDFVITKRFIRCDTFGEVWQSDYPGEEFRWEKCLKKQKDDLGLRFKIAHLEQRICALESYHDDNETYRMEQNERR